MLTTLKEILRSSYTIDGEVIPFGDNQARKNVYLVKTEEAEFIIKVESLKQLTQVNNSIKIAKALSNSETIFSSNYLKTTSGDYFVKTEDNIITLQVKEALHPIETENLNSLVSLGRALGEFHARLKGIELANINTSSFYNDFMGNHIPDAQESGRLAEIKEFYNVHTPDYKTLTFGTVHNDLNPNNIFMASNKYFFIDFELMSFAPVVSDLGVLILCIWDHSKGAEDYKSKLDFLLEGYCKRMNLTEFDKQTIIIFSLRYLYSDENWYKYWSLNGNPSAKDLIPEVREKQDKLLSMI